MTASDGAHLQLVELKAFGTQLQNKCTNIEHVATRPSVFCIRSTKVTRTWAVTQTVACGVWLAAKSFCVIAPLEHTAVAATAEGVLA